MNILLIGSGGREHALAWAIAASPLCDRLFVAPGNPGTGQIARNVALDVTDHAAVIAFCRTEDISLVVVGPEAPLVAGLADDLGRAGIKCFGPRRFPAQLEGSKGFTKDICAEYGIPTAAYGRFREKAAALAYLAEKGAPIVIKADGLAAGKGVTVAMTEEEAVAAIREAMIGGVFGDAGRRVVLEEYMTGEESSILAFCDGETVVPMASSQDHKPALDGDKGPNTGGMGAYSPAPVVDDETARRVYDEILLPCVRGMAAEGAPYKGVLYAGIMVTERGPRVVEFNVRFGDPETQVVLPRMTSDIVPVLVACARGGLADVPVVYADTPCVTVVMASGGYPGAYEKGKEITGIAEAEREPGVQVFHAGTRMDGGKLVTAGGRVLNVTATGATLPEAIDRAYAAVDRIHFDRVHARRDIGRKALRRMGLA